MTDKKQESNALARLDLRKPEDIVREERAKLEAVIAKAPPRWWYAYSKLVYGEERKTTPLMASFFGIVSLAAIVSFLVGVPYALTIVLCVAAVFFSVSEGWIARFSNGLFPLAFLLALPSCYLWATGRGGHSRDEIEKAKTALKEFSAQKVVKAFYFNRLAKVRDDLLGAGSPLEKAGAELVERRRIAQETLLELERRARGAPPERYAALNQAFGEATEYIKRLEAASIKNTQAEKKAREFLSHCYELVDGIDGAMGDAELIAKLGMEMAVGTSSIRKSEEAIEHLVEELYSRVVSLCTAATAAHERTRSIGGTSGQVQSIEEEFAEYERLAEHVLSLDVKALMPQKPAAP